MLFTDGDVRFVPGAIEDAIHYALSEDLDHLTLSPELISRGVALKGFVADFVLVFGVTQRRGGRKTPARRRRLAWGLSTSSNERLIFGRELTGQSACAPTPT